MFWVGDLCVVGGTRNNSPVLAGCPGGRSSCVNMLLVLVEVDVAFTGCAMCSNIDG